VTFEERAAELASAIALACSEERDVDVVASALVQFAGELAHRRRELVVDALVHPLQEATIEARCTCSACDAAHRAELAAGAELLELDAPVPFHLVQR
jgi:hypothetical protein